jgi:hypothetical protein
MSVWSENVFLGCKGKCFKIFDVVVQNMPNPPTAACNSVLKELTVHTYVPTS